MRKETSRIVRPRAVELTLPLSRRLLMGVMGAAAAAPAVALAQTPPPVPQTGTLIGKRDRSARMTTKVFINHEGPFNFVIDTGANRSVIADDLAASLKLPAGEMVHVHGIARVQDAQTVNVKTFKAGEIDVPIRDIPVLNRIDLDADGLLGIDAFTGREITFDFSTNTVHINHSVLDRGFTERPHTIGSASSDVTVSARQRFGQLTIIDADAVRQKITCFIDSGAEKTVGNMAMRRAIQVQTADRNFIPVDVIIHGATGQDVPGTVALVPTMRIGGVHFTSFPVAFADLHTFDLWGLQDQPALMFGMDLLRIFDQVTVDFGHRLVRFRLAALIGNHAVA